MKVLHITTELRQAGAERVIIELSRELIARGHTVSLITLWSEPSSQEGTIIPSLKELGIEWKCLGFSTRKPWNALKLNKAVMAMKPDVVHAHMIHSNILSRIFLPKNIPLVNTIHIAERRPNKGWHFFLDRKTFNPKRLIQTCVSQAVSDFHSKKIGFDSKNLPVVYNGLPIAKPLSSNEIFELRKLWGVSECDKIIGSVGRLDWQKGYDDFFEQLISLQKDIPSGEKWALVVIGEGDKRDELEAIARKASGRLKIILPGFHPQAASAMSAFDLFVMPSRYEGFGLTLIEAMAQGLPIVASDIDSLPELMKFYDNGICVDREQLAETIFDYSQKKKGSINTAFSAKEMADNYLEVYEKAIELLK